MYLDSTDITAASSGTDTWSRIGGNFDVDHQQSATIVRETENTIAADYVDNVLVTAISTTKETTTISVDERAIFAQGDVDFQEVNQGTSVVSFDHHLLLPGQDITWKSGTITRESTFSPVAFDADGIRWALVTDPDILSYSTTLIETRDFSESEIFWLDLRNGFVALTQNHDRTLILGEADGTKAGLWTWERYQTTDSDYTITDRYAGADVYSDRLTANGPRQLLGSGTDPLVDSSFDVLNNSRMYQPDYLTPSGSFEIFEHGIYNDTSRPKPFVFNSSGVLLAASNSNGFNSPVWRFSKTPPNDIDGSWTFYNSPATLPEDNSIDGKTDPRLCPLLNI